MRGKPVQVRVDAETCQGHTLCAMSAPGVFALREDDGHSYVTGEEVAAEDEESVVIAARSCPEHAITVIR